MSTIAHDPPFFVINDDGFDRIKARLLGGETSVPSFSGMCPHRRQTDCDCERFDNVLRDGEVVRINPRTGEVKRVIRASELPSALAELGVDYPGRRGNAEMQWYSSMVVARGLDYVRHVKTYPGLVFPLQLKCHFDDDDGTPCRAYTRTIGTRQEYEEQLIGFVAVVNSLQSL
eukprot:gene29963-9691_t